MNNLSKTVELLKKIEEQPDQMKQIIRELLTEKSKILINQKKKYKKRKYYKRATNEKIVERETRILDYVSQKQMGTISTNNIKKFLDISYRATYATLRKMVSEKKLVKVGKMYSINPNYKPINTPTTTTNITP